MNAHRKGPLVRQTNKPVFIFSSQGGQWAGMGQRFYKEEPVFREVLERCDSEIGARLGWSIIQEVTRGKTHLPPANRSQYVQPVCTVLQLALCALLKANGVAPAAVAGLSMGEAAAAYSAGILELDDVVKLVCCFSRMTAFEREYYGRMGHIRQDSARVRKYLRTLDGIAERVSVAVELGPESTVISGEGTAVERIINDLKQAGVRCGLTPLGLAFHSSEMHPLQGKFFEYLGELHPRNGSVPFYSSVTARKHEGLDLAADYWWRIMSEPAPFKELIENLLRDGYQSFIEIGPHPMLIDPVCETAGLAAIQVSAVPVMYRDKDEQAVFKQAITSLSRPAEPAAMSGSSNQSVRPLAGRSLNAIFRRALAHFRRPVRPPTIHLFLDPKFRRDPYPLYRRLRDEAPVCNRGPAGSTLVSRYHDVHFVLRNPEIFSSQVMRIADSTLLGADPPKHTRVRRVATRAFSPQWAASLEDGIRAISARLVDQMVSRGDCDIVDGLAGPLPLQIMQGILGLGQERMEDMKRWTQAVITRATGNPNPQTQGALARTEAEFDAFLDTLIADRTSAPTTDLVSALLHGADRDDCLAPEEVRSFVRLLLLAGNETTTNLIGNAVLALLRHPEELLRVQSDLSLVPGLVEEVLRYDAPVQLLTRQSTREVQLSGISIPAGARVLALVGSANRDGRRFDDPDRFDVGRKPENHLAFGTGIHYCLGAMLARREAAIALELLLSRAKRLRPNQSLDEIPLVDSLQLRGPLHLPCSLEA